MRVCDCVTQSSLSDIDEEMAHLIGSRERTGRRKNMTKKMKVRVSALVMCAAMLVSAMSILAATRTESVSLNGGGTGTAFVGIYTAGDYAEASSSGSSVYADLLSTGLYGGGPNPVQKTGISYVEISRTGAKFTYATSTHKWTGITHTLTVYP